MTDKTFYVTTPIYYVNGDPHMGHVYTTLACDVIARFKRLDGYKVHFLTGTDEHGLKVKQAADLKGVSPQAFADEVSQKFRDVLTLMNFSNDDFIRTTDPKHIKGAQALWKKLEAAGDIYLDKYAGWYAVRDEAYYGLDELTQGPDEHTMIAPSGAECKWVEEESYFFKLSSYTDKLLAFYEAHPEFIQPQSSYNEVVSFVKGGLKDLSISRTTFDWGVPVPGNEKHVMYVWIDALANYITALGFPEENGSLYDTFWPADVHMVGKEITRFHCVYWPAFLMSAQVDVPKRVFANGWWVVEGEKMSKSLGNVITPEDLIGRYGLDQARYILMREIPFGNDGNFVHESAVAKINGELSNSLGNLCQRTLSMIAKNCEGKVPVCGDLNPEDKDLLSRARVETLALMQEKLADYKYHEAINAFLRLTDAANGYIDAQAPWGLKKTDPERMQTVLYVLAETIRCIGILVQPFMPESGRKILEQVAITSAQDFSHLFEASALKSGTSLPQPSAVFPRLELEEEAA